MLCPRVPTVLVLPTQSDACSLLSAYEDSLTVSVLVRQGTLHQQSSPREETSSLQALIQVIARFYQQSSPGKSMQVASAHPSHCKALPAEQSREEQAACRRTFRSLHSRVCSASFCSASCILTASRDCSRCSTPSRTSASSTTRCKFATSIACTLLHVSCAASVDLLTQLYCVQHVSHMLRLLQRSCLHLHMSCKPARPHAAHML